MSLSEKELADIGLDLEIVEAGVGHAEAQYNPDALTALNAAQKLLAEVERLRAHSTILNTITWKIATALGDVPADADQITGNPEAQAERLIAKIAVAVIADVLAERARQDEKWGEQNHLDGTGAGVGAWGRYGTWGEQARDARKITERHARDGRLTWLDILKEEVFEAFAELDPHKLRAELIQAAAVAVAWAEAIDRRSASPISDSDEGSGEAVPT